MKIINRYIIKITQLYQTFTHVRYHSLDLLLLYNKIFNHSKNFMIKVIIYF